MKNQTDLVEIFLYHSLFVFFIKVIYPCLQQFGVCTGKIGITVAVYVFSTFLIYFKFLIQKEKEQK